MVSWAIYRLKGTPAAPLGHVEGPDEETAIKKAIDEFQIEPALQKLAQGPLLHGDYRSPKIRAAPAGLRGRAASPLGLRQFTALAFNCFALATSASPPAESPLARFARPRLLYACTLFAFNSMA